MELKFKKNETFYIREGWFEKAINTIKEQQTLNPTSNIFYKNDGVLWLGLGSNMVKGLKYWLQAATIINEKNQLTEFGENLFTNDRYLDSKISWHLIHAKLCENLLECPIFNLTFNSSLKRFTKDGLLNYLTDCINDLDPKAKTNYLEADLNIFLKSYLNENEINNPEDNYVCPLSSLKLLKKQKDLFVRTTPQPASLPYTLIIYLLQNIYDHNSFDIEDSMIRKNSPYLLFNLDKSTYLQYLDKARKAGLITVNKTAGLNAVYFNQEITFDQIYIQ